MEIKQFLCTEIQAMNEYKNSNITDLEKLVDLFLAVVEFPIEKDDLCISNRIIPCINDLAEDNGLNKNELLRILNTLNLTEVYARKVLFLTNPERLFEIESKGQGYCPVLKSIDIKDSFIVGKMAERRNVEGDHAAKDWTIREIYERIDIFLFDYLFITNVKRKELSQIVIFDEKKELAATYCKKVISSYKRMEKNGFIYLDVHWIGEDSDTTDCNINNLMELILKNGSGKTKYKILGEAGTGKTTGLKRMAYCIAQNSLETNSGIIPLYIALEEFTYNDYGLILKTAELLNTGIEAVWDLLKKGKIFYLLDGYNEILDDKRQQQIAKEIDNNIMVFCPKTKIIISDRSVSKFSASVLSGCDKLFLKNISLEQKLEYFEKTVDRETYNLIKEKADSFPEYYERIDTPFKMLHLCEVVKETHEVPMNLTESYLRRLIQRERDEKKETEIRYVEDMLKALAVFMYKYENDKGEEDIGMPRTEVLLTLSTIKNKLGFSLDTAKFLDLVSGGNTLENTRNGGMNILYEEGGKISFFSRDYLMYFMLEGINEGYDSLLN